MCLHKTISLLLRMRRIFETMKFFYVGDCGLIVVLFKRGRVTRGTTPRHTVALSFYIAFTESVAEKSPKAEHCKTICLTFLIMGFFVSANCLTQNDNTTTLSSRLHVVRSMQCMRSGEIFYNCPYGRDVSTTVDMTTQAVGMSPLRST